MLGFVLSLPERPKPDRPLTATEHGALRQVLDEVIVGPARQLTEQGILIARQKAELEGEERLSAAREHLAELEEKCVRTGPAREVLEQLRTVALSPSQELAVAFLLEGFQRP